MKKILVLATAILLAASPVMAARYYFATSLTGGAAGALDTLDITGATTPNAENLADGDAAQVVLMSGTTALVYRYVFDADGTTAEASPVTIRPDDYATQGVWRLDSLQYALDADGDGAITDETWYTALVTVESINTPAELGNVANLSANMASTLGAADYAAARTLWGIDTAANLEASLSLGAFASDLLGYTDAAAVLAGIGAQADLAVPSQAEAEAGAATDERVWTAERVGQAIAALGGSGTVLGDLITTSPITGSASDIFPGADGTKATIAIDFALTDDLTWGAAAGTDKTWTWDTGAGTDPTMNFSDTGVTFNIFPITPSAAPDADYEVANKKYVDDRAPTNITPVDTGDEDATFYLLLVDGATGSQATETDVGISYNPSTNTLTLTGAVTAPTYNSSAADGSRISYLPENSNGNEPTPTAGYSGFYFYDGTLKFFQDYTDTTYTLAQLINPTAWASFPALNSTYFLVGNGSNQPAAVQMSGDATMANTGAVTIANDSVDAGMISTMNAYANIPVAWMKDGTSAPDATDDGSTRPPYAYRTFASDADEDLNFVWFVPSDLSGSVIQFRVKYLVTNATGPSSEGVAFGLSGVSLGDNDATNGAKGTVVVVTDPTITAAQHDVLITGWSGDVTITNLAAGEVAELAFIRDVSDASDDYGQVVGVIAVEIRYTKNPT